MANPIKFIMIKHHTILPPAPAPEAPPEEKKEEKAEEYPEMPKGVKGEPFTGFEMPQGNGEFECENCEYYDEDTVSCGQSTMMAKSTRPKLPNGRVIVHPEACCEFVNRIGKKDKDDDDKK